MVEIASVCGHQDALKGQIGRRLLEMLRCIRPFEYVGRGGRTMWDVGCVAASVLFFAIAIGYTMGCERLGTKEKQG
jgi:hypothetical protein